MSDQDPKFEIRFTYEPYGTLEGWEAVGIVEPSDIQVHGSGKTQFDALHDLATMLLRFMFYDSNRPPSNQEVIEHISRLMGHEMKVVEKVKVEGDEWTEKADG